ncbi:MAG: hypothetical protein HY961_12080 [Ignavibacteriae bacterium]|nr:hypothetical protein [Ignavibacteriota bacterium]
MKSRSAMNINSTPTTLVPYTTLLRRFEAEPSGKLFCLYGDRSVFRLSLYAASHALLSNIPIALVDGTNRFDVYYIAEFARRATHQQRIAPEELLQRMFISRAFTCYQMEATLTERLPAFAQRKHTPIIIIFGLLDSFYDEQAPLFEVKASIQRIIASLHKLKQQHFSILLASQEMKLASSERNALFPKLKSAMDEVFRVTENQGQPRIVHEMSYGKYLGIRNQGGSHGKNGPDIHHGHPAGDGKLVQVPPRNAEGRSGRTR